MPELISPCWVDRATRAAIASPEAQQVLKTGMWDTVPVPLERPRGPWIVVGVGSGGSPFVLPGHVRYPARIRLCYVVHFPDGTRMWQMEGTPLSWPSGGELPSAAPRVSSADDYEERIRTCYATLSRALELGAFAEGPPRDGNAAVSAVLEARDALLATIDEPKRAIYSGAIAVFDRWLEAHR
jgi:hypothetical protein